MVQNKAGAFDKELFGVHLTILFTPGITEAQVTV